MKDEYRLYCKKCDALLPRAVAPAEDWIAIVGSAKDIIDTRHAILDIREQLGSRLVDVHLDLPSVNRNYAVAYVLDFLETHYQHTLEVHGGGTTIIDVYKALNSNNYEERARYTEAVARQLLKFTKSNAVLHLMKNEDDGSFSLVGHIVCETCDFCETQGDARGEPYVEAVIAKKNIYEQVGRD